MTTRRRWTRDELLVVFGLYCRLPFGRFHYRNPEVIRVAEAIGRTPSSVAMRLGNIASIDPEITGSGRVGLRGGVSALVREVWDEMNADWDRFAVESERATATALGANATDDNSAVEEDVSMKPIVGQDIEVTTTARIGQRFFRTAVMSAYDGRCCVTGLSVPVLLEASHIVPWRLDAAQRTNPRNGLLLSALHHKAFDGGLITLGDDLTVRVSEGVVDVDDRFFADAVVRYAGRRIRLPEKFAPGAEFLAYHRERVFRG